MIFNKKFKIWGKVLTIKVEYDCYEEENEKVTKEQKKAEKSEFVAFWW